MQMKEQLQQVVAGKQNNPEEGRHHRNSMGKQMATPISQNKHEDYLVMSRMSRNSFEEEHAAPTKQKRVKAKVTHD